MGFLIDKAKMVFDHDLLLILFLQIIGAKIRINIADQDKTLGHSFCFEVSLLFHFTNLEANPIDPAGNRLFIFVRAAAPGPFGGNDDFFNHAV